MGILLELQGIVVENANFRGIETVFPRRKTTVRREKKSAYKKKRKKEAPVFVPH